MDEDCFNDSGWTGRSETKGGWKMDVEERYERARKRVRELRDFYQHLIIYVIVNSFLFLLNFFTSTEHWWFIYPLLGWGIGLVAHALSVFSGGIFGAEWEERKIKEYMDKDKW